jgi:hypothetical protein
MLPRRGIARRLLTRASELGLIAGGPCSLGSVLFEHPSCEDCSCSECRRTILLCQYGGARAGAREGGSVGSPR